MALSTDQWATEAGTAAGSNAALPGRADVSDQLCDALSAMAKAALTGENAVKKVAASCFSDLVAGVEARVVERGGRSWTYGDDESLVPEALSRQLEDASLSHDVVRISSAGIFVPAKTARIGVLLGEPDLHSKYWPSLRILGTGFGMALDAARQAQGKVGALEEVAGFQEISDLLLRTKCLDELLLSICRETLRLLSADICGVFLREGDDLVMRDCLGNKTSLLRTIKIGHGKGLAGRVLTTGKPCVVTDYLTSEALSQDYADLVRAEHIRSALGSPLRVNGEIIGVLEVWRRQPSTFTEADVRRIVSLSSLAAIAVHNSEAHEKQLLAVKQLSIANAKLSERYAVARQWAHVTDEVLSVVVAGEGLPALAQVVSRFANADVTFLTTDLEPMPGIERPPWLATALPTLEEAIKNPNAVRAGKTKTFKLDDFWTSLHPVLVVRNCVGWVCTWARAAPSMENEIAVGQAAVACGLYHMERRAAARAQALTKAAILWDLLEGDSVTRQTAALCAKDMQIDLSGSLRVVHGIVQGAEQILSAPAFDAEKPEVWLGGIYDAFEREFDAQGVLRLMTGRGNQLVAIVDGQSTDRMRSMLSVLEAKILCDTPGIYLYWGVSAPCTTLSRLKAAHSEAASATLVARKIALSGNLAIHEELGIVELLTKMRSDKELEQFVSDSLGRVMSHDATRHGKIMRTVKSYFECNCNRLATAKDLRVHEKTVKYRLDRFEALTGFDLGSHEDRVRAHLAIAMYALSPTGDGTATV